MRPSLLQLVRSGVLLRREAIAHGYDDDHISRLVRSGVLVRIRQGAYAERAVWRSIGEVDRHDLLNEAVIRAYGADVLVSHQSAAVAHRCPIWNLDLSQVHITHDTGSARIGAKIVHHKAFVSDEDREPGRSITSPTRTALDVARSCSTEPALIVLDDLLHRGLTTPELLQEGAERMRAWPGTLRHQVTLRLADGRHESAGETRAGYLFWAQGLPAPVPQLDVVLRNGRATRVDFAWPELGVIVEFDGKEKYLKHRRKGESIVDAVIRERRREAAIEEVTGWIVIRITWADLYQPEQVAARILAAVARRTAA